MRLIILLGSPGVGKGTVSQTLVHGYNFIHVSTGELIRHDQERNKALANTGTLVDDDYINKLLLKELGKYKEDDIVLLDGFPRTQVQAEFLSQHHKIEVVFHLTNVSDEFIIKRLSSRVLCKEKGHSFNLLLSPPKVENVCDFDGSELYRRPDDQEEIIKKRLGIYREHTQPLLDYYRKNVTIVDLDANKGKEEMTAEICKYLKVSKPIGE